MTYIVKHIFICIDIHKYDIFKMNTYFYTITSTILQTMILRQRRLGKIVLSEGPQIKKV